MQAKDSLKRGIARYSSLNVKDKHWVVTELLRQLPLNAKSSGASIAAIFELANVHPSVFISHSHSDRGFVRSLAKYIERFGIRTWIDEAEIKYGDSLVQKIGDAVRRLDLVLAILSKKSVKSGWVKKELELAMTQEIKGERVRIIPVLIESCRVPKFIPTKLMCDMTTRYHRTQNRPTLVLSILEQVSIPQSNHRGEKGGRKKRKRGQSTFSWWAEPRRLTFKF